MKTIHLPTHWSASDVNNVLEFLTELQAVIQTHYEDELHECHQDIINEEQQCFDFDDDFIHF